MKMQILKNICAIFALALLAACCSGCSLLSKPQVPPTQIGFDHTKGTLFVKSPKNVSIGKMSVTQSNGVFNLVVENYSSTNDNQVISAVVTAQAAVAKANADTINSLASLASQAAANVVKP